MIEQFWRRGKQKLFRTSHSSHFYLLQLISIAVIGVIISSGYSSYLVVQIPNGPTFVWNLEPSRR
jgi:hypothetical protein